MNYKILTLSAIFLGFMHPALGSTTTDPILRSAAQQAHVDSLQAFAQQLKIQPLRDLNSLFADTPAPQIEVYFKDGSTAIFQGKQPVPGLTSQQQRDLTEQALNKAKTVPDWIKISALFADGTRLTVGH